MNLAAILWEAGTILVAAWLTVLFLGTLAIVTGWVVESVKLKIRRVRRSPTAAPAAAAAPRYRDARQPAVLIPFAPLPMRRFAARQDLRTGRN